MQAPAILIALAAAAVVAATQPAVQAAEVDTVPWPSPVVRAVGLGRSHAAADVLWLKTVQLVGSDRQTSAGLPNLEKWIEVITDIDPSFEQPYYLGAALLVTDENRADKVDLLLARAEENFPNDLAYPMLRGFLFQFGKLDPVAAASHYRRASQKKKAPDFLAAHALRLEREGEDCGHVLADMRQLSAASTLGLRAVLESRGTNDLLARCVGGMIERASVRYRMNNNKTPTLDDLVREGAIRDPPRPPGQCWHLEHDVASLIPCP